MTAYYGTEHAPEADYCDSCTLPRWQCGHPMPDPLPGEPWTELGYANRLVHAYGHRLRYVPAWGRWFVWDGTRWQHDQAGQVSQWATLIARAITTAAYAIPNQVERGAAVRTARRGETNGAVKGVIALAGVDARIAIKYDQLDADPYLLNCPNGTLDLRDGRLRPHDPADLITKITGAGYTPDTTGRTFDQFLSRIQPEQAMRDYLARLLGHALEGRVVEHVAPIFHGAGRNGKGTLTGTVLAALGDYAAPADPNLLTARTFDAHPTSVADLHGLRLALLEESDEGRRLAEATVKRLTGGDRLKARRMREDFWSFDPSHSFIVATNYKPTVTGTDEGIWRRLRLVPFTVVIPKADENTSLKDQLTLELDAVLAWLVRGHADWKQHGLADPDTVTRATAEYRDESDVLALFIGARCLTGKHHHVESTAIYAAWRTWATENSDEPGTQKAFSTAMTKRGYELARAGSGRMSFRGITLQGAQ